MNDSYREKILNTYSGVPVVSPHCVKGRGKDIVLDMFLTTGYSNREFYTPQEKKYTQPSVNFTEQFFIG